MIYRKKIRVVFIITTIQQYVYDHQTTTKSVLIYTNTTNVTQQFAEIQSQIVTKCKLRNFSSKVERCTASTLRKVYLCSHLNVSDNKVFGRVF